MISFETLWNDLWQAYRQIRNAPGFAGAVILVLAAGFGISTAIFSNHAMWFNLFSVMNIEMLCF